MAAWACAVVCGAVHAEPQVHALLIWVSDYGQARANLPGAAKDALMARDIAKRFGVAPGRQVMLSEKQVTQQGLDAALDALALRIRPGDRVLIYFSGHGNQLDGGRFRANSKCSEGVVMQDGSTYLDYVLQDRLQRLVQQAGQVVMMNDSCHAGGASTRSLQWDDAPDEQVKAYPFGAAKADPDTPCGVAVNKGLALKDAVVRGVQPGRLLYLAAARADELAYSSPAGSRATLAWHHCLTDAEAGADFNQDGWIDGTELLRCAAPLARKGTKPQTLGLEGDAAMVVARSPRH